MDQIENFLQKLGKNERKKLLVLLNSLQNGILPGNVDVKPLKGIKNCYRLRKGKLRIIFFKEKMQIGLVRVDFRKDVY